MDWIEGSFVVVDVANVFGVDMIFKGVEKCMYIKLKKKNKKKKVIKEDWKNL